MTQNDISAALSQVAQGQAFITCAQLTRALGRKDADKVRRSYLLDLEALDGRYYLIRDVAAILKQHCKM